jgi:teichuronic acid exporter
MLSIWVVRPRLSTSIHVPMLKKLLRWGLPVTGSTLMWQFHENSDFMIIGKILGSAELGYYTMAFRLSTMVNDKISSVVNRVTFPSLSALQENPDQLVEHWFSVSRKLALINFPILAAIALNGEDFITLVLGNQWLPAVAPLRFLCVVGAVKTLSPIGNIVITVFGRTDLSFYLSLLSTIVLPLSFALGCKLGGTVGVAMAWCIVYPIMGLIQLDQALKLARTSFRKYAANLKFSFLVVSACALAMLPFHWVMAGGAGRLITRSATGLTVYTLCLLSREDTRTLIKTRIRKWRSLNAPSLLAK